MTWDLAEIRSKVRKLTGRPDTGQISDIELDSFINHYYQNVLPIELDPEELEDWYLLNTVIDDEDYTVEENYLTLSAPFTIAGWPINFYLDKSLFFEKFPETQTYTANQPTDVLFYNRTLLFRPKPDAVYQFKAATILRPDPLVETSDAPLNQLWGPVIAYGAAIEIKGENAEDVDSLTGFYDIYLTTARRPKLLKLQGQRAIPRF